MTPERLRGLLQQADAAHPPPAVAPARLLHAVRRRAAWHRQRRWAIQAAAGLFIALTGATLFHQPQRAARVVPPPAVIAHETHAARHSLAAGTGLSLAALNRQADSEASIAMHLAALLAQPAKRPLALPPAPPDPLVAVAAQREQAARTLVEYADRMQHELAVPAAATAAYRDAAKLFPDTIWARVANVRLASLTKKQGV